MAQAPLRNFVNGKYTDPRGGAYSDVVDPSTGEAYTQAPVSGAADVDEALNVAATAFESWRDATGKPVGLTLSEEPPPSVDQLRFFAGAARMLEGLARNELHRRVNLERNPPRPALPRRMASRHGGS